MFEHIEKKSFKIVEQKLLTETKKTVNITIIALKMEEKSYHPKTMCLH